MKNIFKTMTILLCFVGIISITVSFDLYEGEKTHFENNATEFKNSLGDDEVILIEVKNSVAQKVYYAVLYYDYEGICYSELKVHNYATNETKSVISAPMQIDDYFFGGEYGECFEIMDTKLFDNRFFIITWTEASGRGIFYIDIRNDSVHYIENCSEAEFSKVNDNIVVTKECYVNGKWGSHNYEISMSLSDEAYALNRKKQNETTVPCMKNVEVTKISVGAFYLGQRINSIPASGDFYDRIEKNEDLSFKYDVFCGDNKIIELTENNGKIARILIYASYIGLNNGIHPGMTGEELERNYNAKIILENELFLSWTRFEIPGFGSHMFFGDVPENSMIDWDDDWEGKPIKAKYLPGCKLEYILIGYDYNPN